MKYQTVSADGIVTAVYQKAPDSGPSAVRCETFTGSGRATFLFVGEVTYQLFPDSRSAVELIFMKEAGIGKRYSPFLNAKLDTAEGQDLANVDGKTCYKVRMALDTTNATAALQQLPKGTPVPDACEYLIETNSYHVLKMTMLQGRRNYGNITFQKFEPLPDLSDDLFRVPSDYTIEKANSLMEVANAVHKNLIRPPKNIPKGFAFDSNTHKIVKVDPKTGAFIPLSSASQGTGTAKARVVVVLILGILSAGFLFVSLKARRKSG